MTTTDRPTGTPSEEVEAAKLPPSGFSRRRLGVAIAAVLIALFCLAPILWQLLTSVKVNADISAVPTVYFPTRFTLNHYTELFTRRPFLQYVGNSFLVSILSTLLALGLGAPAAYALARLRIPGERVVLAAVLIVTLFPYILLFLGLLEVVRALNLGNNYLALIIPYTAINLPLTILVMRSFFQQLPRDLEDAAKVDGFNTWQMLTQIVLPMTLPALVTTGILTFISAWNEFIFALTFITREDMKTIPVAAAQLGGASIFEIPYGPIAAATVLGTLPLVILVLLFQRKIVQGLTAGAVKG
ncbi:MULTISPECIES: carbohydrate ABC transporter permease [Trichocoleus]|uniref:Carbohydrate ABC transporter permease n=1 Tax=Trichocoleus desertorum GB2-A4 TaxID=2933944 RepID=A0ABV0J7D9_9CYAN|nr:MULTISPECIES: carbohydrate ABC transporter permease [unclassified Trichocoleus]MBD1863787.1 carbohydrate ABC transporter permease [Trichocoleus sp. FACHB-46]MBD2095334.1 carbohydrate ABC transporter permease [Trichocoleus sp. FACHB-591]MBD2121065.1 carbohydrate ABC transporter permease [Trichocoleus sp. FACHB-262]